MTLQPCEAIRDLRLLLARLKSVPQFTADEHTKTETGGICTPNVKVVRVRQIESIFQCMDDVFDAVNANLPLEFRK